MEEFNSTSSEDTMTTSVYNFLDNLLEVVRTSENLANEAQERDRINILSDIKPGGYSEDLFLFLSKREKEEYFCSVCYSVIKDVHQCTNGHKFCYSCIYVWSTCNRAGADCCPTCRCDGIYARNEQLNEKIGNKRVKCQEDICNWRGFLKDFSEHVHRYYESKEISRYTELPSLERNDYLSSLTTPRFVDEDQFINENSQIIKETLSLSNDSRNHELNRLETVSTLFSPNQRPNRFPNIHELHIPPFPALNSTDNLASSGDGQRLEYRRLAPTYASRRNNIGGLVNDSEHLAMMLILVTSNRFSERINTRDHTDRSRLMITSNQETPSLELTRTSHGDIDRSSSRLQEFRDLNRRLSEVANSLDILIENTGRQGDWTPRDPTADSAGDE